MKRSLTLVCLLASGLTTAALAQTPAAEPMPNAPSTAGASAPTGATKVAVIMFQQVVAQTNEGQRDFSELRQKFEPKQAQLKSQSDEIDSLKKALQTQGANLSDAERQQRLKTIDEKEKSLQRSAQDAQSDFQTALQDTYNQLAQKVYGVLQAYVQQNGYSMVLDASQQQSPVLWMNNSSDISKAIVDAYNTKSGVPAPANPAPAAPGSSPAHAPTHSTTPRTTHPASH
ncbi:OmpH family outer membrane protein [Acidipila rosea]|uniref:Periplasmic chaperone for outer membrane proteins Skp n=1 Tax=Acidipila rosea TaxID=768535 RepID=A0A4R1L180_9BACT|nr:OmpH family outer membrane protein [Acidipila rosea]MBW4027433.1 OmpH family outer membrane protein [Acidobacteriota bacterium]MBW4045612.1 OmpH family outer membrane protein [Acidobacteriota bacterium]TCK71698.1 periplasmic chaperone for outer membrane proteins Skp [Acidipila rosea]